MTKQEQAAETARLVAEFVAKGGIVRQASELKEAQERLEAAQKAAAAKKPAKAAPTAEVLPLFECVTHYLLKSGRIASQQRKMAARTVEEALLAHRKYVEQANGRFIAAYGETELVVEDAA